MLVSFFSGERDREPKQENVTWDQLVEGFADSQPTPCTIATCGKGEHEYVWVDRNGKERRGGCKHKYIRAWSPAAYPQGITRGKKNVGSVGLLVLDLDHMTKEGLDAAAERLASYQYIAHASHSNAKPNKEGVIEYAFRFIIPLTEPVLGADWPRFWITAVTELGGDADPSTCDASRLYFMPTHRADARPMFQHHTGGKLDVRRILATAPALVEVASPNTPSSFPPASGAMLERARDRLRAIGPAVEGKNGDNTTYSACAALLHDFALSDAEAWPLLVGWNQTNVPPWPLDELQTKMANARSYADGVYGAGRAEFDASETLRVMFKIPSTPVIVKASGETVEATAYPADDLLSALGVPDDVIAASAEPVEGTWEFELAKARRDVTAALGDGDEGNQSAGPLFAPAADLFAPGRVFAKTPWLMRGLLPERSVVLVIAPPKSTKSWVALEMSLSLASGMAGFSGKFEVPAPRKVTYFFAEDQDLAVRNRIRAFAAGRSVDPATLAKNLSVHPRSHHLDITRDGDLAMVVASCRMVGGQQARVEGDVHHGHHFGEPRLGMLVLDPFRDVQTGKENESDDMSAVFSRLRVLATLLRCTVLIPHHAKKSNGTTEGRAGESIRGSSAIYGAVDGVITLEDLKVETDDAKRCTVMSNSIKGEFKAARAAAPFRLTLTVMDDEHDQAINATWKYQSMAEAADEETTDEVGSVSIEDRAVEILRYMRLEETRANGPKALGPSEIQEKIKGTASVNRAAYAFCESRMWVERLSKSRKLRLTDRGKAFLKEADAEEIAPPLEIVSADKP